MEMTSEPPTPKAATLLRIAAGLLALAAGALLAGRFLPEWRMGDLPREELFRERYQRIAARVGFELAPGEPAATLVTRGPELYEPSRHLGEEAASWRAATRTPVRVQVLHEVAGPEEQPPGYFVVDFSLDGDPVAAIWWNRTFSSPLRAFDSAGAMRLGERLGASLTRPGEKPGPARTDLVGNFARRVLPLAGSDPRQHLLVVGSEPVFAVRRAGPVGPESEAAMDRDMRWSFAIFGKWIVAFAAGAVLFFVLVLRSRLSGTNGALLAGIALVSLLPMSRTIFGAGSWGWVAVTVHALWIFFLWSSAESLARTSEPGFATSLDALRAGRLGPRGGRSLLAGFAFGAGLAGLRLAAPALAEALPGVWPEGASLHLPPFGSTGSPVTHGILLAGGTALAYALALRILPVGGAVAVAALAAGWLLSPMDFDPFALDLAAGTLVAVLLLHVLRRHGLTALLLAGLLAYLLPLGLLAALHPGWMPAALAIAALVSGGVLVLGFLGLARPAEPELARLSPPGFVRRLEEERRVRDEMVLLARMQRGLLPPTLPQVPGWELAAHSALANEAGGDLYDVLPDEEGYVWIAAGDVAGHGYSCAVAQAMVQAALAGLVGRGRSPGQVLAEVDRVLRTASPTRSFTTLALLRLRPETGEVLMANAGHPHPLLAEGGAVREVELPGRLPLGQGPRQDYPDHELRVPAGGTLVLASDGLFEAVDRSETPYGFERVQEVLRGAGGRSAEGLLQVIFADWRHHLRTARPLDDTTILVLRRAEAREEAA
jgi:hypothetical protein